MRRLWIISVTLVVAIAAGSCSKDDASNATTNTTASTAAPPTTSAAVPTTAAPAGSTTTPATTPPTTKGCSTPSPTHVPASAKTIIDVDGDGRADRGYIDETDTVRRVGIITAAGGFSEVQIDSASPIALSALVATIGSAHQPIVLISDGRGAQLWTFQGCSLKQVLNPEGQNYTFDLGPVGNGTGVGCIPGSGGLQLVGVLNKGGSGTTVNWKRTPIRVSGTSASNGKSTTGTFTVGKDDKAIALLSTISCGDRTIAADGIHDPASG